jgi:hypothetical protein
MKTGLNAAITEADAIIERARALSPALGRYDLTLTVPAVDR